MAAEALMHDSVWLQQNKYEEAEAYFYAVQAGTASPGQGGRCVKNEITQAREQIANALKQPGQQGGHGGGANPQVNKRLDHLENENKDLKKTVKDLQELVRKMESRITSLEGGKAAAAPPKAPAAAKPAAADDDDDDMDLFGDDDEEEEEEEEASERKKKLLDEYKAKKAKKPQVIAKSSVILDVKPWDDETDMKETERLVRTIVKDGLVWGVGKLVELAYGIKKLVIICVVEDDKISIEDLKEQIETDFEDHVQSVDVAAFNKI